MILSTDFSSKAVTVLLAVLICLLGCTPRNDPVTREMNDSFATNKTPLTAVLPLINVSGTPAPLKDIRQSLINSLKREGLRLIDEEALERFIVSRRIRYVGGINGAIASELKWDTGADSILITSVELYSDEFPPKIALTSRLVSAGDNPVILWTESIGLAGNDSTGLLELFLIEDPQKLLRKALQHLSSSLAGYLAGERWETDRQREIIKFWPKVYYRSPIIESERKYTVAVVPFFNFTERRFAGDIMAKHFVRQLRTLENFTVIEPGIIRQALLQMRIIMEDGISLADASALFSKLNPDLILAGKVFDYQDYRGTTGRPIVDFSALLIEKKSREVVWSCRSFNKGDDGVYFFDWGKINTAHAMATDMVLTAVETIVE